MINTTLTGITHTSYITTTDIPFAINDTFYSNSNISFTCTAAGILDILSKTINAGNITNFALYYRLIDNTTTNTTILSDTIDLTAVMFVNNSIIVSLDDLNNTITHNYLLDDMNETEIYSLHKKYNLVIRIYQKSTAEETTHLANLNTILGTDIVQDLNYILNGLYNGPYDVGFSHVDLASKNDFSLTQIKTIFEENPTTVGVEYFRIFYPKNKEKNNSCPLFIFFHGQGQFADDYDFYYSKLASYGYFCVGIHYISSYIENLKSYEEFFKKLDHFKNNINVINDGLFNNLINFNKINFSGHSRGGAYAISLGEFLRAKKSISELNVSFEYTDIKSIIPIAQASDKEAYFLNNGMDVLELTSDMYTETRINNYFLNYSIPTLYLHSRLDNDVTQPLGRNFTYSHLNGFSFDNKKNISETICLTTNTQFNHNGYALQILNREDFGVANDNTFLDSAAEDKLHLQGRPKFSNLDETGFRYNSFYNQVNYLCREILNFISINNFNTNKIKKIRFYNRIDLHNYDNKNKQFYTLNIKYKNDDINFYIDEFNGITLSSAGLTGMTLTSSGIPIGFTYDYAQEYYLSRINSTSPNIYLNKLYEQKIHVHGLLTEEYLTNNSATKSLSQSNSFCGFYNTTYKGIEFDVNSSNTFIGYTFSSNLNLNEDNYLILKGGLPDKSNSFLNSGAGRTYGFSIALNGVAGNTLDANFTLTLYDLNNNSASLSSSLYNNGFAKNANLSSDSKFYHYSNQIIRPTIDCMYFRAGDFYLKNPNLDLANINQILLSFGPSHGSTHCTVGLDEFFVLENF